MAKITILLLKIIIPIKRIIKQSKLNNKKLVYNKNETKLDLDNWLSFLIV